MGSDGISPADLEAVALKLSATKIENRLLVVDDAVYRMLRRYAEPPRTDGWRCYREAERRVLNPYHPHKITEIVTMPDGTVKVTRHWRD